MGMGQRCLSTVLRPPIASDQPALREMAGQGWEGDAVSLGTQFVPGSQRSGLDLHCKSEWGPMRSSLEGRWKEAVQEAVFLLDPKGVDFDLVD